MTEITTSAIFARIHQTSATQTGAPALASPTGTSSNNACLPNPVAPNPVQYDSSYSDPQQSEELRRSSRSHTRSARAQDGGYGKESTSMPEHFTDIFFAKDTKLAADKQRAERAGRTRARNNKGKSSQAQSDAESAAGPEAQLKGQHLSRSPTPIFTTNRPEAQSTRNDLQEKIIRKFHQVIEDSDTQMLINVDGALSSDPTYASQSQEQSVETRFLPPVGVGVGGGFHLNHSSHSQGSRNSKTYGRSMGGLRTISTPKPSCAKPNCNPPSPHGATACENDPERYHCLAPASQTHASLLPPLPVHDSASPFLVPHSAPLLGYPDDQGSHRSPSPAPLEHNYMESQSLGGSPLAHSSIGQHVPRGSSGSSPPLRTGGSIAHISTSSKSLGECVPTPSPVTGHKVHQRLSQHSAPDPVTFTSQQSDHSQQAHLHHSATPEPSALRLTPSEPEGGVQRHTPTSSRAKRPLDTPATPLRPRKRPATTFRPTVGGRAYNGRLNIVEINSKRVSTTGIRSQQLVHRRTSSSKTRHKKKSTARITTPVLSASQQTGIDDFDLLDDFDDDQLVVDSALKGELVESGYRKPTAHDLPVWERAIWREVRDVTWGFSMGQGNFQSRSVFASWVSASFSEVVKLKLPHMDTTTTTMSDDMMTVILNNLCNARYQDLLKLRKPVQEYYRLKNPSTPDERQDNEDRVREVYPNWFHYQDLDDLADLYEGEIMYSALESMFFYGPKAIGSRYPSLFSRSNDPKDERKHLAVMAYLATMVQFCLGEWTEGYFNQDTLNATKQHSVWLCHFDGLKNVSLKARKRLIETYNQWVQNAHESSQAQAKFSKKTYVQAVIRLKDVRPDTPSRSPSPNNQD
ncbi:hypothetical protein RSOL_289910, partial [Rhizoctonia solani AG-3 Rhs1AP]